MRIMLKSKIHRAKVTESNLNYIGSITVDSKLMKMADIFPGEQVHVVNLDNGNRLVTYAIEGKKGEICLNGAAAHHFKPGEKIIIMSYCLTRKKIKPRVILVDNINNFLEKL